MNPANYRYYCIDRAGHLRSGELLAAKSDEDAIGQIVARHTDAMLEIWRGERLVAKQSPRRLQA